MPIYDYHCEKCEMDVSILRSISKFNELPNKQEGDEFPDSDCPHEWKKKLSTYSVQKGWGWGSKGNW